MAQLSDNISFGEYNDQDIYDVPPPRYSASKPDDGTYMNLNELEIIPVPALPPKKRMSVDDIDARLGIRAPPEGADRFGAVSSPTLGVEREETNDCENAKKVPVAAPRLKVTVLKVPLAPVAAPRKRLTGSGGVTSPPVVSIPEVIKESDKEDVFESNAEANEDDKSNNNLLGFSSWYKTTTPSVQEDGKHGSSQAQHVNEEDLNEDDGVDDYVNTDNVLDKLQAVKTDYVNMSTWNEGHRVAELSTSLGGPEMENKGGMIDMYKFGMDYMVMKKPRDDDDDVIVDASQIKKQVLVTPTYPPLSFGDHRRSYLDQAPAGDGSFYDFSDLDFFRTLEKNETSLSPANSRISSDLERWSVPPPKFTPPPLPSNLLIDLLDDHPYKTPLALAPAVPVRPSGDPPPPVPLRAKVLSLASGAVDSPKYMATDYYVSQTSSPSREDSFTASLRSPEIQAKGSKSSGTDISDQSTVSPVKPMRIINSQSQSTFYVQTPEPCDAILYERYEMESGAIYELEKAETPFTNPTVVAAEQRNLYEAALNLLDFQGVLYQSVNTSKPPEKRWCCLLNGCLSLFANRQSPAPLEVVELVSMVSIAAIKDDSRPGNWFELHTRPPVQTFLFSVESETKKKSWINKIAQNMAMVKSDDLDQILDIERGGNVFFRSGAESDWIHTWIHLIQKTLFFYNERKEFEEIDLRKSKGLRSLPLTDRCTKGFESCYPLALDLPNGRVIYIQSDLKRGQDAWFSALQSSLSTVDDCLENQPLTADNVPLMVDKYINFISAYGLDMEGIYRHNGQSSRVTKLQQDFRSDHRGMIIRSTEYHIHDVATALKRFFRQLNDPLLTNLLYDQWIQASRIESRDSRLDEYKRLIGELPRINYFTLKRIISHVAQVADMKSQNKMDSMNLASIFGPILMKVDKDNQQATGYGTTNQEIKIIKDLVDNHRYLFDIKDNELVHEQKIADAITKIRLLRTRNSCHVDTIIQDGVLLSIYIGSNEGDVLTTNVPSTMTADELLKYVSGKAQVASKPDWTLFEIICSGELERPIHPSENIFQVAMKWTEWPQEFRQKNYLCYKFNYLIEPLQLVLDPQVSLFSEMKYASRKAFHKNCFQYSQYRLGFRKDARAENPTTSWQVEDIVIYLGIQRIRCPPTKWGFTFYASNERLASPYFGHSVSCGSEEEMYRWLSAMLHSQHPGGYLRPGLPNNSFRSSNQHQLSRSVTPSVESNTPMSSSMTPSSSLSNLASKFKLPFSRRS